MTHKAILAEIDLFNAIAAKNTAYAQHNNPYSTPPSYHEFPSLIDFDSMGLTDEDFAYFTKWASANQHLVVSIKIIKLKNNSLSKFPAISCFPMLKELDLSCNLICNLPNLQHPNLKVVTFDNNKVSSLVLFARSDLSLDWLSGASNPLTTISKMAMHAFFSVDRLVPHNEDAVRFAYESGVAIEGNNNFDQNSLYEHFNLSFKVHNSADIFETAFTLAAITRGSINKIRNPYFIPAPVIDKVLSFLYKLPSDNDLQYELQVLQQAFPSQSKRIEEFEKSSFLTLFKRRTSFTSLNDSLECSVNKIQQSRKKDVRDKNKNPKFLKIMPHH